MKTHVIPSERDLMNVKIRGTSEDRFVEINSEPLHAEHSQKIRNHSPDGFMWGYPGSGPAQLALAILMHFVCVETALKYYQDFKSEFVSEWHDDFEVQINLLTWLRKKIENNNG